MQNQNIFYEPRFPQYNTNIYCRYNNLAIPFRYPSKSIKRYNYYFSSEEENYNSKGFYFLTDKNNSTINQNYINKLVEEDIFLFQNSQNIKDYNYQPISVKKMENYNKQLFKENDPGIANIQYVPLSNREKRRNSNEEQNLYYNSCNKNSAIKTNKNNNMNFIKKKFYNQNKYYKQPLIKHNSHNSHSVFSKNYNKVNNTSNNELKNQNNYEEKSNFDLDKEIELDQKTYCGNNTISLNTQSQTFTNNFTINTDNPKKFNDCKMNTDRAKNCIDLINNKPINNIYKNNYNLTKIIKNNKITNTTNNGNSKEENKYKPPLNKNISYSHIENIAGKKFIKKNFQNNKINKKKINLIINTVNTIDNQIKDNYPSNRIGGMNKIKKISLVNIQNMNENTDNKNHSFYETKSLSKVYPSQKNMKIKNNNFNLNLPISRNTELKMKKTNETLIKVNINNIAIGDNNIKEKTNLSTRKINSSELNAYLKKEGKSYLHREISKKTIDNNKMKNIDYLGNKENINTMNKMNTIPKNINNNYKIGDKVENIKKIMIKVDKAQFNNIQANIINKKIINNICDNTYNEYIIDLRAKKINTRRPSGSSSYRDNYKPIKVNKIIKSNLFSYFPKTNENKNNKKHLNKKNLIQLLNINHKAYEEDFPLNAKKNKNYLNKNLKSQIAFRIVLFATKKPENKKYYLLNKYYSENIRDKPQELESEF